MQTTVYNQKGAESGTIDLPEYIFGAATKRQPASSGSQNETSF